MSKITDDAVGKIEGILQSAGTVVDAATKFVQSVPQMIRDAVALAEQSDEGDVSGAMEDLASSLDAKAAALTAAMTTTPNGDAAPVGNLPASTPGTASDASSSATSGVDEQDANVK